MDLNMKYETKTKVEFDVLNGFLIGKWVNQVHENDNIYQKHKEQSIILFTVFTKI